MKDFEIINQIGAGGSGKVFYCIKKDNKKEYAMKVLKIKKIVKKR